MLTQLEKKNKFLIIVAKLHACKIGHYLHNWSMPHLPVFWTVRTKTFATDREEVKSRKREKKVKEEEAGQKRLRLNFAYVHALNSKILFIAEISKNSRLSAKYCIPRKISKVKNHLKVKCSTSLERWSYVKGLKQLKTRASIHWAEVSINERVKKLAISCGQDQDPSGVQCLR